MMKTKANCNIIEGDTLTFKDLEWNRKVYTAKRIVIFKRYDNKMYWLRDKNWIEIEPNYEYDKYEYI